MSVTVPRLVSPDQDFHFRHPVPLELAMPDHISAEGEGPISDLVRRIQRATDVTEKALLLFQYHSMRFAAGYASTMPQPPELLLHAPQPSPMILVEQVERTAVTPVTAPIAVATPKAKVTPSAPTHQPVTSSRGWDDINLTEIINHQNADQSYERILGLTGPEQRNPDLAALRDAFTKNKYYIAEPNLLTVSCSLDTGKPIIVEGPPGTGKTSLAEELALAHGLDPKNPNHLIEIFCTPDIKRSDVLYDWNDSRRLMDMQFMQGVAPFISPDKWRQLYHDLSKEAYSLRYLNIHRLLKAVLLPYRCVVLIDELDKTFPDFDNLLLDIIDKHSYVVPEIGRLGQPRVNGNRPIFVITSNALRELSSPLKRRANYVYFNFLNEVTETEVLVAKTGVPEAQAQVGAKFFREMREHKQFRPSHLPSTAEALYTLATLRASKIPVTRTQLMRYHGLWLKGKEDFDMFYRVFADEIRAAQK